MVLGPKKKTANAVFEGGYVGTMVVDAKAFDE
jgi:hypothetical protein